MCQTCSSNTTAVAGTTHTYLNPFLPNVSLLRFPTGIFEMHLYLPGIVSKVEIVPHNNYLVVRGHVANRLVQDVCGRAGVLVYSDQGNGEFSRDVPICLSPGTEFVVLETRQEAHEYIIRYTVRNSLATTYCANGSNVVNNGACGSNAIPVINQTHGNSTIITPANNSAGYGNYQGVAGVNNGCGGGYRVAPIINRINTPRSNVATYIS